MHDMIELRAFTSCQSMTSSEQGMHITNDAISLKCLETSLNVSSKLRSTGSVGKTKHFNPPLSAAAGLSATSPGQRPFWAEIWKSVKKEKGDARSSRYYALRLMA